MQRKILLDCDPGHDDAVAMMLAWGNPSIELLGVTTVGGNQTLDKVTRNALSVATVVGMHDVPIAAGCRLPLVRPVEIAPDVHGDSGLDGVELPEPAVELDPRHGVDLIIETIMSNEPGTVTLVPTGPLTNIAMAARKEPRIVERVQEVVLMGGGYHVGNWSPVAEFNIKVDPEAAHIVFNEKWPIVMVGLDLTHQALATDEVAERIAAVPGSVSQFTLGLFTFFRKAYQDAQGFDFPPVHDPCTLAYLIDPTIVETVKVPVDVELNGSLTTGMTVADFRAPAPEDCHTKVATRLDAPRFWGLVVDAIDRIQKVVDA
ncbi:ribonucleoside hydrolase [Actinomyces sp. HMSC075C01]|uniref:Ribonucleoside hydrolase n=1 Tax=Actinomyces oris TaxID=544580 RepID=A0A1Q8VY32_9ACTO|nr:MULTISPECIES: nucleoside hydrolase [Actinomyces]OFR53247.1 ribonucleoside hydrolase [Actinomyces sp. HMSC075C01]OLO53291.1 ribonucleoside hydrolase [Actinomyces oris]OLO59226.1 ribonucleoside hydrolase [Actinomyces oris]